MTEAKGQTEPSMEEILASIRRIISEDGDTDQPAPIAAARKPTTAPVQQTEDIGPVLELTEMVDDDGSVVSIGEAAPMEIDAGTGMDYDAGSETSEDAFELPPVVDAEMVAPPHAATAPADMDMTDGPDEADSLGMDALVAELAAEVADAEVHDTPEPMAMLPDPEPEPSRMPERAPAPSAPKAQPVPKAAPEPEVSLGDLVSSTARSSSAAAFARLAQAVNEKETSMAPTPEPVSISGKSLDSMVAEMLRPMLKEWLDQNLPAIVERMVQKEIKRLTTGT